ncbi:AhpC/TSA family protein [Abditibacterium utsteinense]|uniref:AhpC/TSA family protein n=1 Tax=Abditibacterium utsteinense TaxID=1960156 RepID=A0A2S8SWR4_9BACT|nr:redoxin domain-containing protein [Abditibacterium utsteinense]PQV65238.1 AhpC/TSA family protein [Abditibacterium utsteinense]
MKKWTKFAAIILVGAGATSLALHAPSAAMAKINSSAPIVSLGQRVAPLQLRNTAGKPVTVAQWNKSKATVLMFVATKCPVSNAYNARMASLQSAYASKGVRFIGINSNQAENGAEVAAHAKQHGLSFPIYKDPQNKIANRFNAQVTPEVYVVGTQGDLLYKGRIDNSQNTAEVNEKSLQLALNAILAKKPISKKETRAFGCSIKRVG